MARQRATQCSRRRQRRKGPGSRTAASGHRELQRLFDSLSESGRNPRYLRKRPSTGLKHKNGLAPKSIRNLHVAIHSGFSYAMQENRISIRRNPADGELLRLPSVSRRKRLKIALADVRQFLAYVEQAKRDRRRHLWIFLMNTGLRISEALALRWEAHLDLDVPCVYVEENQEGDLEGKVIAGDPKTSAGYRPVPLTEAAVASLQAQRGSIDQERQHAGDAYDHQGLVFPNALGRPDNRGNVRRALKIAAGHAKVSAFEHLTTHDFRRICASLLRASRVNKEEAMAILGHKHAAMLEEVYASAVTEELLNAARKLQQYVYGATDESKGAGQAP